MEQNKKLPPQERTAKPDFPMPPTPPVVTQFDCNCCGKPLPDVYVNFHFHASSPMGPVCVVNRYHVPCWLVFEDHIKKQIQERNAGYRYDNEQPDDFHQPSEV